MWCQSSSFERGQRKDDVAARYRARFRPVRASVHSACTGAPVSHSKRPSTSCLPTGPLLVPAPVGRSQHYYFYLQTPSGTGLLSRSVPTCLIRRVYASMATSGSSSSCAKSHPVRTASITASNGAPTPIGCRQLADSLGSADVQAFRSLARAPALATDGDRSSSRHRHRLSIWQLEMSLTQVFTTPVYDGTFRNGDPCKTSTWPAAASACSFPTRTSAPTRRPPENRLQDAPSSLWVAPSCTSSSSTPMSSST